MGNSHQAKRYPSSVSAPIYPIKRAEKVIKGIKGLFFLPFGPLSREINLLSEGRRVLHSAKMATMGSTCDLTPKDWTDY